MRLGIADMPERTVEWRRAILPFSTMMTGGRGARYVSSATEFGSHIADRNCTQFYEFFQIGVIVNYLRDWCRFADDEVVWRRYYPVFRECAEFFRRWLIIELPGNAVMLTWLVDVDESHYPVQDGAFSVCGAACALETAWRTAERLGIAEPEIAEWKRLGAMTLRLADQTCGGTGLNRDPLVTTAGDPVSCYVDYELAAAHPLPEDSTPDEAVRRWREAYRRRAAPEDQMSDGKTNVTGEAVHMPFWSWGPLQSAHSAAMLDRPDDALRELRRALTTVMDFGALNESAQLDLSDVHHPWFNTAAGAYVRALVRMLVYPLDDEIRLLPGIPAGWDAFGFSLPVHRGGRVAVTVREGRLVSVRLSESRHACERLVRMPLAYLPAQPVFAKGVAICRRDAAYISVAAATRPGAVVELFG